jgi:hypothetical protein
VNVNLFLFFVWVAHYLLGCLGLNFFPGLKPNPFINLTIDRPFIVPLTRTRHAQFADRFDLGDTFSGYILRPGNSLSLSLSLSKPSMFNLK